MEPSSSSVASPPPQSQTSFDDHINDLNMDLNFPNDPSSAMWDWNDLLDIAVDFPRSVDSVQNNGNVDNGDHPQPQIPPPQPRQAHLQMERVRKRDPRVTRLNFLRENVLRACSELDVQLMEDAEGLPGKKRVRVIRPGPASSALARCQVPRCQVDISKLKGYHKRHRVCLRCAYANTVLLDGVSKRYCQQCGK
ncbi:hypothetical protein ACFE04_014279 [Oxalis oulophora]